MNCSLPDSAVTSPSFPQDPQDSEDQGRSEVFEMFGAIILAFFISNCF